MESIQPHPLARLFNVPPESESDTLTAEAVAVQVIQENADLAKKYATGDMIVLGILREKALKIAGGRLKPAELENTLVRKLGASI